MKQAFLSKDFRKQLRGESREIRQLVGQGISGAQELFGQPHHHAGLGIRQLASGYYELRVGIKLRVLFRDLPDGLLFEFISSHDEIQRFIKSRS